MKKTNFLFAIPASLYSKSFYNEVGKTWIGRSFIYLLIVLALTWIATAFVAAHGIWEFVEFSGLDFSRQLPTIQIQGGVASTVEKKPTFIEWTRDKKMAKLVKSNLFAIIDTHNQIKDKDFQSSSAMVLVRSHKIYIKRKGQEKLMTYQISKDIKTTIGPKKAAQTVMKIKKYVYSIGTGIVYLVGLAFSYIRYLLLGLVYGLIGMVLNANLKRKLDYGNLLSLSLVAFTPALLLKTICFAFSITFPFMGLIFYLIPLFYLYFGIKNAE